MKTDANIEAQIHQTHLVQAGKLVAKAQQWPVGSRWDAGDNYILTVVGFDCDLEQPMLFADEDQNGTDLMMLQEIGTDPDELIALPADQEAADRARSITRGYGVVQHLRIWDTPTSAEQILAARDFFEADHQWMLSQRAEREAMLERSRAIDHVASRTGRNQSATARLLGLDQSRVNRAIASLPVVA